MGEQNFNDLDIHVKKAGGILNEVKKAVLGKDEIVCKVLMAILAKGHILIDDIPGVGKTTMAMAFAEAMGLRENRMQFTPDVLPSDLTGFSIFNRETNKFEYKQGAVMCNLFLGDEINRTSPKTQAALLQVMEEGRVSVDGVTRVVPKPFIVIATENPTGSVGTQKLPESQMDRFMIKITIGYPEIADEVAIMKGKQFDNVTAIQKATTESELMQLQDIVHNTFVDDQIYEYIAKIAESTRLDADLQLGISPRGSLAIVSMAKAGAFLRGHAYVLPSDVHNVIFDTIGHRIILNQSAKMRNVTEKDVINKILNTVPVPKIN